MVQINLKAYSKKNGHEQDGDIVPMKKPIQRTGQTNIIKIQIKQGVIHNVETDSTKDATERTVKILDINYLKNDLKETTDITTQLNTEEIKLILGLLKKFEDFFGGKVGHWETDQVELEIYPNSKLENYRCNPVPLINKKKFKRKQITQQKLENLIL